VDFAVAEGTSNLRSGIRSGIVGALQLLSSPERQLDYERRVPRVRVPTELLCMWFDDTYLPHSEAFARCFSSREFDAITVFNNYFADHEKLLPEPRDGIKSWLKNETWQGIMREASRALAFLES
jgi:hypothetical protein